MHNGGIRDTGPWTRSDWVALGVNLAVLMGVIIAGILT